MVRAHREAHGSWCARTARRTACSGLRSMGSRRRSAAAGRRLAKLGPTGRAGSGSAARPGQRGAREAPRAGARGPRTAPESSRTRSGAHEILEARPARVALRRSASADRRQDRVRCLARSFGSRSTRSRGGSSLGASRAPPRRASCSTRGTQALHERQPTHGGGLVHHGDRGGQLLSLKDTGRRAEAGIASSVGSVGDPCGNALGLDGHRPLQDRGHPPAGAVAKPRGGGARHPRTEAPREAANGSMGSTTAGSPSPSAPSRPPRPRTDATRRSTRPPRPRRSQTKSPRRNRRGSGRRADPRCG